MDSVAERVIALGFLAGLGLVGVLVARSLPEVSARG